ncbi:hypothetical protein H310_08219 [Aphanomyces invadans]|uniref:Uncharacterized protein n=1 Tax=Aphanomyces invadans TaxID=157072 RepID=A0A024U005_9STRA|nr:hypothetical protein H310_08219 [Aphanomyces invadans]ETV99559.1 hypothetical protein H310_08219 [Aphanomyces invadans]|eukprot:XP_008872115.1 hypothetical protein H310_08219 [Aphanomyces invadans]
MTQRDPTPAAFSMRLGAKKRKHCDSNHANTTSKATPCAAFLSQTQLDGMSDYDYADMTMDVQPSSSHILSLEDAAAKVKRLKAEGNTLAEAGLFRAAVARFQHGLDIDPDNGVLYELQAQAYLASNDYFRGIEAATRATELCPEWSDGFATLAHCQFNFGELDLAHAAMLKVRVLPLCFAHVTHYKGVDARTRCLSKAAMAGRARRHGIAACSPNRQYRNNRAPVHRRTDARRASGPNVQGEFVSAECALAFVTPLTLYRTVYYSIVCSIAT